MQPKVIDQIKPVRQLVSSSSSNSTVSADETKSTLNKPAAAKVSSNYGIIFMAVVVTVGLIVLALLAYKKSN